MICFDLLCLRVLIRFIDSQRLASNYMGQGGKCALISLTPILIFVSMSSCSSYAALKRYHPFCLALFCRPLSALHLSFRLLAQQQED